MARVTGSDSTMAKLKPDFSAIKERTRRAARGSTPPAGVDPDTAPEPGPDGSHRRAIRQRLRRTRSVRRARLSELGLLVAEMHARGRWNQELVDDWARELERADSEVRGLEQALRGDLELDDLIGRRIVAQCGACGRIGGAAEKFCAGCGRRLPAGSVRPRTESPGSQTLVGELTTIRPSA